MTPDLLKTTKISFSAALAKNRHDNIAKQASFVALKIIYISYVWSPCHTTAENMKLSDGNDFVIMRSVLLT